MWLLIHANICFAVNWDLCQARNYNYNIVTCIVGLGNIRLRSTGLLCPVTLLYWACTLGPCGVGDSCGVVRHGGAVCGCVRYRTNQGWLSNPSHQLALGTIQVCHYTKTNRLFQIICCILMRPDTMGYTQYCIIFVGRDVTPVQYRILMW